MANSQINKLLEFAHMQMATEAFLVSGEETAPAIGNVRSLLVQGNTHTQICDNISNQLEIAELGWAFGQIASLEKW